MSDTKIGSGIPSDAHIPSKISGIDSPLSLKTPSPTQDSLLSSERVVLPKKDTAMDQPDIPSYKDTPPTSTAKPNPYLQGSLMADVYIAMLDVMALNAELREKEAMYALDSMGTKFETAMLSAEAKKQLALNRAYQSLTSAVQKAGDVVLGAVNLAETAGTDVKAQKQYQEDIAKKETVVNEAKGKFAEATGGVGVSDTVLQGWLDDPKTVPGYNRNKDVIDAAHQEFKTEDTRLTKLKNNQSNEISTRRQEINGVLQLKANMMRSLTEGIKDSVTAGIQISGAALEKMQAQIDAITQITSDYLQGQQSEAQRARDVFDQLRRSLEQLQQSINSSFSGRA